MVGVRWDVGANTGGGVRTGCGDLCAMSAIGCAMSAIGCAMGGDLAAMFPIVCATLGDFAATNAVLAYQFSLQMLAASYHSCSELSFGRPTIIVAI